MSDNGTDLRRIDRAHALAAAGKSRRAIRRRTGLPPRVVLLFVHADQVAVRMQADAARERRATCRATCRLKRRQNA